MPIDSATTTGLSVREFTEVRSASKRETLQEDKPQYLFFPWLTPMPTSISTTTQGGNNPYLPYILHAQKSIDITTPIEETLNWLVTKGARIETPSDVRAYLLQYTDILLILPTIFLKANRILPDATQLSLELYRDPEIDDSYLTFYVRQVSYESGILDMIDEINLECETLFIGIRGWLITTTDFRLPR